MLICSIHSFLNQDENKLINQECILPLLIKALKENQIPTPSPIAIQAIIGGFVSQTLVSIVTGQGELKDAIEFDATTLNVTECIYWCVYCYQTLDVLKKLVRAFRRRALSFVSSVCFLSYYNSQIQVLKIRLHANSFE